MKSILALIFIVLVGLSHQVSGSNLSFKKKYHPSLACQTDVDCEQLILCNKEQNHECYCTRRKQCDWIDRSNRPPTWKTEFGGKMMSLEAALDKLIKKSERRENNYDDDYYNQVEIMRVKRDSENPDIGPDTCGQDREELATWFEQHGSPALLDDPIPSLVYPVETNPYDDPSNPPSTPDDNGVCGVKWTDDSVTYSPELGEELKHYQLQDFDNEAAAELAGFDVTHSGHCGSCSPLQDLGVYLGQNLTTPTRLCGVEGLISEELMVNCLKRIGFSDNCIPIWAYNIVNTRKECFAVCLWSWVMDEPFNHPDGSLNACLQCDEDKSGPNFKYFSGRTRRNSGIPSSIYRPPETIYNMTHCYWYGDLVPSTSEQQSGGSLI